MIRSRAYHVDLGHPTPFRRLDASDRRAVDLRYPRPISTETIKERWYIDILGGQAQGSKTTALVLHEIRSRAAEMCQKPAEDGRIHCDKDGAPENGHCEAAIHGQQCVGLSLNSPAGTVLIVKREQGVGFG